MAWEAPGLPGYCTTRSCVNRQKYSSKFWPDLSGPGNDVQNAADRKEKNMLQKVFTDKAPAAIGPYSQGILVNGMLFASGQNPINPATGEIEGADIMAQAQQVMKNVGAILAEAGTDYTKVVKTTCFLADMGDFAAFNEVYARYFTEKPARSCVAVKTLPKNVLCEVEVIAAV